MFTLFFKGLLIGLAIAAPVGPIGILIIQRSLHEGFKIGLVSGMGAATVDAIFGLVAAFGLTAVSSLLIDHQFWIRMIGGVFLVYLGIKLLLSHSHAHAAKAKTGRSLLHAYTTTFILTITNPMTILSFIAVFAGLGLGSTHTNYIDALGLVIGITFGSALWWLFLSGGVAFILHKRVNTKIMRIINIISGLIILGFGVLALVG